jgi:hypothetical protein
MPQRNDGGSSAEGRPAWAGIPVEIPQEIQDRVRILCLALPEVTVHVDESRSNTRSTAYSFDIRRRSFCLLVAAKDPTGKPIPRLVLRADPDDREALLSLGHPYFTPAGGPSSPRGTAHREHRLGGDPRTRDRELSSDRAQKAHRPARLALRGACVAPSPSGDRRSAPPSPLPGPLAAVKARWLGRR